jgi:hypothetical protein
MPTTDPNASFFLKLPLELRRAVYEASNKQALGRLAQTCKQVNAEINPRVDHIGEEKRSPWDALRRCDFPSMFMPQPQDPSRLLSGKNLYRRDHRLKLLGLRDRPSIG